MGQTMSSNIPISNSAGITDYSRLLFDRKFVPRNNFLAFTIDNFLPEEDCKELIRLSEDRGYEIAEINVGNGEQKLLTHVRNSDRVIIDDAAIAAKLWERLRPHVPVNFGGSEVVGLNERLRFLRYDEGGYFIPHYDGKYTRPDGSETSRITFFLFLNEGYEGGESTFVNPRYNKTESNNGDVNKMHDKIPIKPETGKLLVFQHDILHEGSLLVSGRKYAVRTDVMFKQPDQETLKAIVRDIYIS